MPTYLHPGVYIEEIPSGAKPIEGVATSVTAFVGTARKGPAGEAVLIQNLDDYTSRFGNIHSETDAMGLAVSAFYQNGGKSAYVCRLVGDAPPAAAAFTTIAGQGTVANAVVLRIAASSVGDWGEEIYIRLVKPSTADTNFALEVGHIDGTGKFVEDEEFTALTMNEADTNYVLTRINGVSQLVEVALEPAASLLANLQRGSVTGQVLTTADNALFQNGIGTNVMSLRLNVDGLGIKTIVIGPAASLGLTGADNATDGAAVAAAIEAAVQASDARPAFAGFTCDYNASGQFVLSSGTTSSSSSVQVFSGDRSATDLAFLLRIAHYATSPAIAPTSVHGSAKIVPVQTLGLGGNGVGLLGGVDAAPGLSHYQTFFNTVLQKVRDVNILVLPGVGWSDSASQAIVSAAVAHCEATKSRMVIIDPPPATELDQGATVDALALPTSTYSVLYYPWLRVANPFYDRDRNPNAATTLTIAPSAFAAGMWAKIDGKRGVWKAPAGVETNLLGVAGLEFNVEDGEQDQLNPLGVNAVRKLPSFGSVIWGSRTLATKADPEWRYVPVRRTAIFIEQSIYQGIQWAVFEPNAHPLWGSLRANIGAFMNGLFRAGAFQGATANDAYFVRCGLGDTMTQADIDRGQVIVIVGFAPLKPAEFVIIRIQQKINQQ